MKGIISRVLCGSLLLVAATGVACSEEDKTDSSSVKATVQDAANQVKQQTKDAWASLRTDGDRLIDNVQTRNDPQAKQQLLDKCRDTVEKLRKDDSANADRVNTFCNKIRDTDPNTQSAWTEIKSQFNELNRQLGS